MDEEMWLENALYPWLDSDCMADETHCDHWEPEDACGDHMIHCMGCEAVYDGQEHDWICPECECPW